MSEFVPPRFGIECKGVIICQASEFPVVGKNDFSITALGPFLLVDGFGRFVVAVAFGSTEFLEFLRWDMELYAFCDGFKGGMAVAPFHLNNPISRIPFYL